MRKVALVFPGQGSQYVGMGRSIFGADPAARAVFERADDLLDRALSELCFNGPEAALAETANTQVAVFVTNQACLAALGGPPADLALGHSLGEYSALAAAGVIGFDEALRLVGERADLMQRSAQRSDGGMLAVLGPAHKTVSELTAEYARQTGRVACVANYNCPGQTVVSAEEAALGDLSTQLTAAGAKRVVRLKVSGAFHSSLMGGAEEEFGRHLSAVEFKRAKIPVASNATGRVAAEPEALKAALARQMTSPVRWEQSVLEAIGLGATTFVEVGPGRVLSGLIRRISADVEMLNVEDPDSLAAAMQALERLKTED